MQKFYINTVTGTWYNSDGDLFRDGMPEYTYQNSYRIAIQLCSSTPSSATEGVNPEEWEKYTGYSAGGVTALLSADNDFRRRRKGTVVGEIPAGAVSQIAMDIESASAATIRSSGTLRLFNTSGVAEVLKYDSVSISGETVTFSISSGSVLENSYSDGAAGDVPDAIYAQAAMIAAESDPANGLFVFDFVIYSEKLREKFEYSDLETLDDLKGIELLIFSLDGDAADIHDRYFCKSCSIKAPMAEPGLLTEIPDSCSGNLASMITTLISNGFDVEFSADGDSWHAEQLEEDSSMRFRLKVVGESGEWIVVQLKSGPANVLTIGTVTTGEPGTNALVEITGEAPNQTVNFTIPRGQQGQQGATGADGADGADGEPGPANVLTIGTVTTGEPGTNALVEITGEAPNQTVNFTIPRGQQGQQGATGADGADGADGEPGPANVLTIGTVTTGEPGTQAAATITGESPNQVLNLTIPRGETGAQGPAGSGTGDMLASVYDSNSDGKVDAADTADSIGSTTAAQVADAVSKAHEHSNKTTLDKFAEQDGALTFNGEPVGGGTADSVAWENVTGKPSSFPPETHQHAISDVTGLQEALDNAGAVKTVNGVGPDETGNVALTARADLEFTSASLSANVLTVENATVAGLVVLDADGMQQLPEMTQSGTSVQIDFTGWTVSGSWRVQFSNILAASDTPDLSNYYTKAEIDAMFGTFEADATAIIGEA